MTKRFIAEQKRLNLKKIIYNYVEEPFIIDPIYINCEENIREPVTHTTCEYEENKIKKTVSFSGKSTIGGMFDKLVDLYCRDYPSLSTLEFVEYSTLPTFNPKSKTNSEAPVEVRINISSSGKEAIPFRRFDNSVLRASIQCVFDCVQYYVNSEMCFKKLKFLIKEAQSRSRSDVAQKYISDISEIVKVTSYSDV